MDEDGYFTIVDRMKDMILTAGFNVYPAEIERVLCGHPAVALAAVGGIPDETKGELAKAYVVLKPERRGNARGARRALPAAPGGVQGAARDPVHRRSVPMTSSGKIMRRLLAEIDDGSRTLISDSEHVVA